MRIESHRNEKAFHIPELSRNLQLWAYHAVHLKATDKMLHEAFLNFKKDKGIIIE